MMKNLTKFACGVVILCSTAVHGQTFRSTEGNTYAGRAVDGGRDRNCVTEIVIERNVRVSKDEGAGRLTFTMDLEKTREAVYRGGNSTARIECDEGRERSTAAVRFYIDDEASSSASYSGTVISASRSLHGFKVGERIRGTIEVFDGGRGLDFSNEEFIDGVARVLARNFRNSAGVELAYFVPGRAPDLALSCKVIASDGVGSTRSSSNSGQAVGEDGRSRTYQKSSSGSSTTSACLAHGWENIRKTVSVWVSEKRCDGLPCEVSPTFLKWRDGNLSRLTGQMKDSCYTYECDKAAQSKPRF